MEGRELTTDTQRCCYVVAADRLAARGHQLIHATAIPVGQDGDRADRIQEGAFVRHGATLSETQVMERDHPLFPPLAPLFGVLQTQGHVEPFVHSIGDADRLSQGLVLPEVRGWEAAIRGIQGTEREAQRLTRVGPQCEGLDVGRRVAHHIEHKPFHGLDLCLGPGAAH